MIFKNPVKGEIKLSTLDMELLVGQFLNPRINLIIPNVSWGFCIHECDLLCVTKNRYLWEVEIKISKSDLIKDKGKRHNHKNNKIKRLYFAIPDYLQSEIEHIPEPAGIIVVNTQNEYLYVKKIREAKQCGQYRITEREYIKLMHLGAMRIWGLKAKLQRLIEGVKK